MKKLLVVLLVFVNGLLFSQVQYVDCKDGDNDARFTLGLLKTLFSDSLTKYEFGQIDRSIFKLYVCDESFVVIDNFGNWILNLKTDAYPTDKFIFTYCAPSECSISESINVIDKYTLELVRTITISYTNFDHAKNQYRNVRSIRDFILK
jgi:hypothetical protein